MAPHEAKLKLRSYRAKRDFSKTAEPSGEQDIAASRRRRFVVQKHAATRLHFDFRLELDGVFKSWAVTRGPSLDPAEKRLAVEVEDHPLDYGDFEGTIPKGQYGGGTVMLWDRGYWEIEGDRTPQQALAKGDIKFRLDGKRLNGSWALVRMRRRDKDRHENWLLIKHRDEHAVAGEGERALDEDTSVASGRSLAEIAAGKGRAPKPFMLKSATARNAIWNSDRANREHANDGAGSRPSAAIASAGSHGKPLAQLPDFIPPQLCKAVDAPPRAPGWGHEVKLDGYRLQMRVQEGHVTLRTRNGVDWTTKFPAFVRAVAKLPDCVLDGEICAVDGNGAPDFPALQTAIALGKTEKLVYFVFDLLCAEGEDLRDLPLRARKERLKKMVAKTPSAIRYVDDLENDGKTVLEAVRKMNLEGIISKRLDAPYRSGRNDSWQKTKVRGGQEVVIGGWAEEGARFRSLLVGAYKGGKLAYLGRVGTGFDSRTAQRLHKSLVAVAARDSPFHGSAAPKKAAEIRWAKPMLVAEIEFAGWTAEGLVRQAAFKALREDKLPSDVVVEHVRPTDAVNPRPKLPDVIVSPQSSRDPRVLGVAITHPEKELWPAAGKHDAVTKLDLARYLEAIGERLLDYIKGRPCSIVRAPDGITAQQFFQRHEMRGQSKAITLVKMRGDKQPYVQFDTTEAIIAAAQISAVEFHPTNCSPFDPDTPGRLVFDLDPAPNVPFARVVEAAHELKGRLETVGLAAFCKTTGGKGLHVVTPFSKSKTEVTWDEAKAFALEICRRMAGDSPAKYLTTMAKKDRSGRIFLDYLRNDRLSTAVAAYSPRARPGAPVSMPIAWAEVKTSLDPARFAVHSVRNSTGKTPWADFALAAKPLVPAARRLFAR